VASEKRPKTLIVAYRQVFDFSPAGKAVLAHLLGSYGLFQRIENDEQRSRHNMGVELLEHLGAVQGLNYERLIESILKLTIPAEAVEDEG
jgi:hypothetical protein